MHVIRVRIEVDDDFAQSHQVVTPGLEANALAMAIRSALSGINGTTNRAVSARDIQRAMQMLANLDSFAEMLPQ